MVELSFQNLTDFFHDTTAGPNFTPKPDGLKFLTHCKFYGAPILDQAFFTWILVAEKGQNKSAGSSDSVRHESFLFRISKIVWISVAEEPPYFLQQKPFFFS